MIIVFSHLGYREKKGLLQSECILSKFVTPTDNGIRWAFGRCLSVKGEALMVEESSL